MRWLALLLLAGCAAPSEVEVGVGHTLRDGGFQVGDTFSEGPPGEQTGLLVDYDERDLTSGWVAFTWDLRAPPLPPQIVEVPALPPVPEPRETAKPADEVGSEEQKEADFDADMVQMLIAGVLGAIGLWGGQRGTKMVRAYRARRKGD